jgi:uncharacterized protein
MSELQQKTTSFTTEWQRWQAARWNDVSAPHGIASLADTVWLGPRAQHVDGVVGLWRADGETVIGTGLCGSSYTDASAAAVADTVVLRAGDTLRAGNVLVGIFVREGSVALRRFDPDTKQRTSLRSIAAYQPDPAWVVDGHFTPRAEPLEVEQFDGHHTLQSGAGTLEFSLNGVRHRLTATQGHGELSVVFCDATSGNQTYRFRFLRPHLPDDAGMTSLDFNRAFLPPCSFSEHYVCPLPSPGNRLDIPVTVGERLPVWSSDGS